METYTKNVRDERKERHAGPVPMYSSCSRWAATATVLHNLRESRASRTLDWRFFRLHLC